MNIILCALLLLLNLGLDKIVLADIKTEHEQLEPRNILFITGTQSRSHRAAIEPLAHALVSRGHNVTFLTPQKPTKPNPKFHEVSTKALDDFHRKISGSLVTKHFLARLANKYYRSIPEPMWIGNLTILGAELLFTSPEFKPWVDSSKFDLVFIENCVCRYGYAVAYKFNAPVILFGPSGIWGHDDEIFGIPTERSWLPNYFLQNVFTEHLTFYDKVYITLYPLYNKVVTEWIIIPKLDELARRALEMPQMPSIQLLEQELTSLIFMNEHFSQNYAKPLPPSVIQIGGMHCIESNGSLPDEMESFIAEAGDNGFIYISFGTIINMSVAPDFLVKVFFDAINHLSHMRFLWKWDGSPPNHLPKNVFTANYFPQQHVLAHNKIKGFITHGGQMSTQQAVCHAVPTIVVPVWADQPYNAKVVSHHQIGIQLELSELISPQALIDTIGKLINDPIFALSAKKTSELFKDRPLPAVDTAVYWTEYVLRHKNTSHLKPMGMYQSWWEKRLLDVWLFILVSILIFVFVVYKIALTVYRCCIPREGSQSRKLKKN